MGPLRPALLLLAGCVWGATSIDAQPTGPDPTVRGAAATPDSIATDFLRSLRAIRWEAVAQRIHPESLERFRTTVEMIADADQSGEARGFLVQTDAPGFTELAHEEVFARSIGAMIDDMPGLMHALYDRDDEVIGHVADGSGAAHVVYRTTARISGAVPEVKVLQLRRSPAGWRVLWSDELEVLEAALRGIARQ